MTNLIPNKHWNTIVKFGLAILMGILAGKPVINAIEGAVDQTSAVEQKSIDADKAIQ